MKHVTWSTGSSVSADGSAVVAHAGSIAARLRADRTDLTDVDATLVDGAGSSHGLRDWLTAQGSKHARTVEYSVGFASTSKARDAIAKLPKTAWTAAKDSGLGRFPSRDFAITLRSLKTLGA